MQQATTYKSKQFLFLLIKLSIVFSAAYYIYYRLTHNKSLDIIEFWEAVKGMKTFTPFNILLLIILSSLNWGLETFKWQIAVSTLKKISFSEALEQSIGSLTVSLLTPNRVGEYGAKALYYQKNDRKKIVFLNLITNFSQMGATILFGSIGIILFLQTHKTFTFQLNFNQGVIILSVSVLILWVFRYVFPNIKTRFLILSKALLKSISLKVFIKVFGLSVLRYITFSHQFYFLLLLFNLDISYVHAMTAITVVYLLSSLLPMLFIFDVLIKGSVAVWVFSFYGIQELNILMVVLSMWILNVVIPSLPGSYFVLNYSSPRINHVSDTIT